MSSSSSGRFPKIRGVFCSTTSSADMVKNELMRLGLCKRFMREGAERGQGCVKRRMFCQEVACLGSSGWLLELHVFVQEEGKHHGGNV